MSTTIDERVVSMQFDNKQFESNVRTSMSTLEKLKHSLNFRGTSKGLDDLSASVKKVDMTPLGNSAHKVGLQFSAMYTMADQALRNITTRVQQTAEHMIRALTIDPVKTGLSEYETKINAIQTIMSNTSSKGTTMSDITRVLDELNTYADKTIYNFAEMTRNIGTFTAAGIGLEESAAAIQGIANLAAASGSSSQQASTAMYQLSQALAAGTVKLMDWNSVVNAGMGGQLFQEALKDTAREMGIAVDSMIEKAGSFRESLSDGWITAEVLSTTLRKFTVDGAKEYAESMVACGKYTREQADALIAEAEAMNDAATKVKTFTQLLDTLKESAQSGWSQTWEIIIGDFEEARSLWTRVSDSIGELINNSAEGRNSFLSEALDSKWEKLLRKINAAGVETSDFEEALRAVLKKNGHDVDALIEKYGSLEKVFRSGEIDAKYLSAAIENLGDKMIDLTGIERELKKGFSGDDVLQMQRALKELGYELGTFGSAADGLDGIMGSVTTAALKKFQEDHGLEPTGILDPATHEALQAAMKGSTEGIEELIKSSETLTKGLDELGGRELLIESLANSFRALMLPLKAIKNAWREAFDIPKSQISSLPFSPEQLYGVIEAVHRFSEKLLKWSQDNVGNITRIFKGLFAGLDIITSFIGGGVKIAFKGLSAILSVFDLDLLEVVATLGDALVKFRDWIKENDIVTKSFVKLGEGIKILVIWLYELGKAFLESEKIQSILSKIKTGFSDISSELSGRWSEGVKRLKDFVEKLKSFDDFSLDGIKNAFLDFKDNVLDFFFKNADGTTIFDSLSDAIKDFWATIKDKLGNLGVKFEELGIKIGDFFSTIREKAEGFLGTALVVGVLAGLIWFIKKISDVLEIIATPISVLDDLRDSVVEFMGAMKMSIRAEALKTIAEAIGIIAGALVALTLVDHTKLLSATIVLGGFMAILTMMSKTLGDGSLKDAGKMVGVLLSIAGAVILISYAVKIIGGMAWQDALQGIVAVGAIVAGLLLVAKKTSKFEGDVSKFGKMMLGLGAALMLFTISVAILGHMDASTLLKGGLAIGVFLLMVAGTMRATKHLSKELPRFGTTMMGLAGALLLLSLSVAILGNLDTDTLIKGTLAVGAFLLMMGGLMKATKSLNKDMPKFGTAMMGLSLGLLSMAVAVKILGEMDTKTLVKGGLVITAFLGMMVGLMWATKLLSDNSANISKVGTAMLSFSASMLLISASIMVLSFIDTKDIFKAIFAIGSVGLMFGALIALTKFAKDTKDVKSTIFALTISITALALSIAALSFIEPSKLKNATVALSTVIGMFSLLIASTKFAGQKVLGTLIVMTSAIVVMAGAIFLLKDIPAKQALGAAGSLSALLLALSTSFLILSKVKKSSIDLKTIGMLSLALFAVLGIVSIFAGIAIASLPTIGEKLGEFMTNLSEGLGKIDVQNAECLGKLFSGLADVMLSAAALGLVGSLSFGGMAGSLLAFTEWFRKILPTVKEFAIDISRTDVELDQGKIDTVIGIVKALSEMANSMPSTVKGGFGFIKGLGGGGYLEINDLRAFGEFISGAATAMKDVASGLHDSNVSTDDVDNAVELCKGVSILAEAANKLPGITAGGGGMGLKGLSKFAGGGGGAAFVNVPMLSAFADFVQEVAPVMEDFASSIKTSGVELTHANSVVKICEAVKVLAEAAEKVPSAVITGGGGSFGKFVGGGFAVSHAEFNAFAEWIRSVAGTMRVLASGLKTDEIDSDDLDNVKSICEAVGILAEAASLTPTFNAGGGIGGGLKNLSNIGGAIMAGGYVSFAQLDAFGEWIVAIAPTMSKFANDMKGINGGEAISEDDVSKVVTLCTAVSVLAEGAGKLPSTTIGGGLGISKFGVFLGGFGSYTDFEEFVEFITAVQTPITTLCNSVTSTNISPEKAAVVGTICEAISYLGEAAGKAPAKTFAQGAGFLATFSGIGGGYVDYESVPDLTGFVSFINAVGPAMGDLASVVSTNGITKSQANIVVSLCEAVSHLGSAAGSFPTKEYASGVGFFASVAGGGALAFEYQSTYNMDDFVSFITSCDTMFNSLVGAIKGTEFDQEDANAIKSICEAIALLGSAAGEGATETTTTSGLAAGVIFGIPIVGLINSETTESLTDFTNWILEIGKDGGVLDNLAAAATEMADIKPEAFDNLNSICEAILTLGQTMEYAPTTTETTGFFGLWKEVEAADIESMVTWFTDIKEPMKELATMSTEMTINTANLMAISKATRMIAEAVSYIPTDSVVDSSTFLGIVEELGTTMASFSETVTGINISAVNAAATAAADLATMFHLVVTNWLYNDIKDKLTDSAFFYTIDQFGTKIVAFSKTVAEVNQGAIVAAANAGNTIATMCSTIAATDYDLVDIAEFGAALDEVAIALNEFSADLAETDCTAALTEVNSIVSTLTDISSTDFSGANSLKVALEELGTTSVEDFVAAFKDGGATVKAAIEVFITTAAGAASSSDAIGKFKSAGNACVEGFANGITEKTWLAKARAAAMAQSAYIAAKEQLSVNSPSKIFRSLGYSVPEGFAMGIDRLGGMVRHSTIEMTETAINGTKSAIVRIAEAFDSDIDAQPTIRPVLDLDEIRSGAGTISSLLNTRPSVGLAANISAINSAMNAASQNGTNDDVISAIHELGASLAGMPRNNYSINGITYDDGSRISEAVESLVRAARVERRI